MSIIVFLVSLEVLALLAPSNAWSDHVFNLWSVVGLRHTNPVHLGVQDNFHSIRLTLLVIADDEGGFRGLPKGYLLLMD